MRIQIHHVKLALTATALAAVCLAGRATAQQAAAEDGAKSRETMFSLIRKGGPVMVPLGIGSILALALSVERLLSLRQHKIIPDGFILRLKEIMSHEDGHGHQRGIDYCEQTDGPVGSIFKAGLLKLDRNEEAVEKAVEDAGAREVDKLKRSLRGLSVIASVSPLLGLLGTVYGMIYAFQEASSLGMGKADSLAKGIYEALVTTAAGLTIAIPTLLMYQYLNSKVDTMVDQIDEMSVEFMHACVPARKG